MTIQAFIEEGRRKGLQEGLEEGRAREARRIILFLGGCPRISPTPALDLFFPTLIDRSLCV